MRRVLSIMAAFLVLMLPILAQQKTNRPQALSRTRIARGKYLVESIGMCGDCHTPRNEKGEFIKDQWLKGTTLDFKPTVPMPVWADKSSNIAGLPGWEKDAAIKFFMTGLGPNELPARPPMPQFRFNQQDAEGIVAYLTSLGGAK